MASSRKEILYWLSLAAYGVVLFGVLLYLRFPAEKFRNFCERKVASSLEEVSCSIDEVKYVFPDELVFAGFRLFKEDGGELLVEDSSLSIFPQWRNITREVRIRSSAFGGTTTAQLKFAFDQDRVEIDDIESADISLEAMTMLGQKLERRMQGRLGLTGSLVFDVKRLMVVGGEGEISLSEAEIELKKTILELNVLEIENGTVPFTIDDNRVTVTGGEIEGRRLNGTFEGQVTLSKPISMTMLSLQGSVVPQAQLYGQNRQLRVIVARMQKRYRSSSLPFSLAGTLGKPTFVFGQ